MSEFSKDDKLEIMHRLQREGRWGKALAYKEKVRGFGEGNDIAWAFMRNVLAPSKPRAAEQRARATYTDIH